MRYDYCLVGGDIVNADHNTNTHDEAKEEKDAQEILVFLRDLLQCKVFFVPGNHDPKKYLEGAHDNLEDIFNLHKKEWILESGLSVVGFGGSLPAYYDK